MVPSGGLKWSNSEDAGVEAMSHMSSVPRPPGASSAMLIVGPNQGELEQALAPWRPYLRALQLLHWRIFAEVRVEHPEPIRPRLEKTKAKSTDLPRDRSTAGRKALARHLQGKDYRLLVDPYRNCERSSYPKVESPASVLSYNWSFRHLH